MEEQRKKLKTLFSTGDLETHRQAGLLLLSMSDEFQRAFFEGVSLDEFGKVTGGNDLPWSSSLLNIYLELHPRKDEIISLDLSNLNDFGWNDLSFPMVKKLRHLSIGKLRVPYGQSDLWPKKLSLLTCHPWNLNDGENEDYMLGNATGEKANLFQLHKSHPQLILHWYKDYDIVAKITKYPTGPQNNIYAVINPVYIDDGVKSFTIYYLSEESILGWAEIIFGDDRTITMYERGVNPDDPEGMWTDAWDGLGPSEDEPLYNMRHFNGISWTDENCEIEKWSDQESVSDLKIFPTDCGLPDNPLFPSFIDQAEPYWTSGDTTVYYGTPRSTYFHGNLRDPQFWLGSMGKTIPRTSVGFNLCENLECRRKIHHVPTQWKTPTFVNGEMNKFTFYTDLSEWLPQARFGLDVWMKIRTLDASEIATSDREAFEFYKKCSLGEMDYNLHKKEILVSVYTYFDKIGMEVDEINFVTISTFPSIQVKARGAASLFEYDALIRQTSHWCHENEVCRIFSWNVFDHTHNLYREYHSASGNLCLTKQEQETWFEKKFAAYSEHVPYE
jgi:hypothetical protein